jgi:hypothetical protein
MQENSSLERNQKSVKSIHPCKSVIQTIDEIFAASMASMALMPTYDLRIRRVPLSHIGPKI